MRALYAIVVAAWTLALFSAVSSVMFMIAVLFAEPAWPKEPSPPKCVVERAAFSRLMVASGHPLLIELPDDLSRRFIIGWNKVVGGAQVDATADTVLIYDNTDSPTFRIVFLRGSCLVDNFDIPVGGFWKVIAATDQQKRWEL
jgi:hypothetical protein